MGPLPGGGTNGGNVNFVLQVPHKTVGPWGGEYCRGGGGSDEEGAGIVLLPEDEADDCPLFRAA